MTPWHPTRLTALIREIPEAASSPWLALTDAGMVYVKRMGSNNYDDVVYADHPLIAEWVGTCLARWIGLPVPDHAIVPDLNGNPCFISRAAEGAVPWSKSIAGKWLKGGAKVQREPMLRDFSARLAVFDTWILNWDRLEPDAYDNFHNILITSEGPLAIDHAFSLMPRNREPETPMPGLHHPLGTLSEIRRGDIYGVGGGLEAFLLKQEVIRVLEKLDSFDKSFLDSVLASVPGAWKGADYDEEGLALLILARKDWITDKLLTLLDPHFFGGLPS